MKRLLALLLVSLIGVLPMTADATAEKKVLDPENTLYLELPDGRVVIQMRPDIAPNHVKRIKELVRQGYYDGLSFHRVIPGFMAQTGDPSGDGTGGTGRHIDAEFSKASHVRGTVSMARRGNDVNSADSQFFICYDAQPSLDGKYTIWGEVLTGMEAVDKIKAGSMLNNGKVTDPTKIVKMRVAADVKE